MRIASNGNVGIGSTSPTQKLDVTGNANVSGTLTAGHFSGIVDGNIAASQVNAGSFQNGAYTFPGSLAVTGALTQNSSNVITQANIASNAVTSLNSQQGALTLSQGTNISLSGTGNLTVNTVANPSFATSVTSPILQNNSADLTIKTNTSGNIVLSPAGNVGIGTTSPQAKLHITKATTGGIGGSVILENGAGGLNDETRIDSILSATGVSTGRVGFIRTNSPSAGDSDIYFSTTGSGALGEKVRIQSSGNVGIGSVSPGAKLDVNGNTNITGTLTTTSTINSQTIGATSSLAAVNMSGNLNIGTAYPGGGVTITSAGDVKASGNIYLKGLVYRESLTQLLVQNNSMLLNAGSSSDLTAYIGVMSGGTLASPTYNGLITWNPSGTSRWDFGTAGNPNHVYVSGNVGIGSTSPAQKLDVAGNPQTGLYGESYQRLLCSV